MQLWYIENTLYPQAFIILVILVILLARALLGAPGVAPAEYLAQHTLLATHRSRPWRKIRGEVGLQSILGTSGLIRGVWPPSSLILDLQQLIGLDLHIWRPSRPCKISFLLNPYALSFLFLQPVFDMVFGKTASGLQPIPLWKCLSRETRKNLNERSKYKVRLTFCGHFTPSLCNILI